MFVKLYRLFRFVRLVRLVGLDSFLQGSYAASGLRVWGAWARSYLKFLD
jgi:hypothetical protein